MSLEWLLNHMFVFNSLEIKHSFSIATITVTVLLLWVNVIISLCYRIPKKRVHCLVRFLRRHYNITSIHNLKLYKIPSSHGYVTSWQILQISCAEHIDPYITLCNIMEMSFELHRHFAPINKGDILDNDLYQQGSCRGCDQPMRDGA